MDSRQVLGGRYRLEERLGEGGMSVVWRAFDLILGRSVAVKVLSGRYATDSAFRESILAEAQAAARVSHPHLASVHDYGESVDGEGKPVPYVVMELLTGPTLMQRLASGGPLPARTGLRICAEIAEALAAAHAHRLVHRDVKPGNVMLTPVGAKLVDFGVAAVAGAPGGPGPDGRIMGTPNYVAPERLLGDAVEPASDVYSLGLLLFRVLTGRLPWPAGSIDLEERADPDPLPPLDGVPPDVAELYAGCVAFDPRQRPSAQDAATRLNAAAGAMPAVEGLSAAAIAGDDPAVITPSTGTIMVPVVVPGPPARRPALTGARGRLHPAVPAAIAAVVAAVVAVLIVAQAGARSPGPVSIGSPPPSGAALPSVSAGPGQTGGPLPSGDPLPPTIGGPLQGPVVSNPGEQPGGPPGTTGPPIAPTSTPSSSVTGSTWVHSSGGSVFAVCYGTLAQLQSWSVAAGYTLQLVEDGPAQRVRIQFRNRETIVTIGVRCENGQPLPRVGTSSPQRTRTPTPPPVSPSPS